VIFETSCGIDETIEELNDTNKEQSYFYVIRKMKAVECNDDSLLGMSKASLNLDICVRNPELVST